MYPEQGSLSLASAHAPQQTHEIRHLYAGDFLDEESIEISTNNNRMSWDILDEDLV